MLTNKGLVEHAKMALQQGWGYVFGTYGKVLDEDLLIRKKTQYPDNVLKHESFIRANWMGKRVADCVGLIKSYLWWNDGNIKYQVEQDRSANGMYVYASEKGHLPSMPDVPGICVWKNDHIGIYIGDGQVIEARGTQYGVIQTPLKGPGANAWTHWLKCSLVTYNEPQLSWKDILKKSNLSHPEEWEKAIESTINMVKANGNLGDIEILKFLPDLIPKIYYAGKNN